MNKTVYADNAATTALSKTAFEAMLPHLKTEYGNPLDVDYILEKLSPFAATVPGMERDKGISQIIRRYL